MLNNLQQLDTIDFRGHIFIGVVRFNNDPLRLERIKVSIPGVFDSSNEAELPWVAPLAEGPIPNGSGFGSFGLVPPVGSKVFVQFQHGNPLYPVYYGSPIVQGDRVAEANVNYPNRYGWRDPRGNVFYVDTTEGGNVIRLQHASGTTITINNDGSVSLVAVGPISSQAPIWNHVGDINVDGTINSTEDVIASGVSLTTHVHSGVDRGGSNTDPPV